MRHLSPERERPAPPPAADIQLLVLNGFELRHGERIVQLPLTCQRLVAFLGIHDRHMRRAHVAGTLWPDATEQRAGGCLRSMLWRLHRPGERRLLDVSPTHIRLAENVSVDYRHTLARITQLLRRPDTCSAEDLDPSGLTADLLPGWYEDWVVLEAERFRQLRLQALESVCAQLAAGGRFGEAIEAGLAAVAAEPLRESAHGRLVRVHLLQGNVVEALRQYRTYRKLLREELGLRPSPAMTHLVAGFGLDDDEVRSGP
jgi:DNA-binding SARP family transcriptional activator